MKKQIALYSLLFAMLLTACSTSQPSTTTHAANEKAWIIFDTTEEMRNFSTLAERSDIEAVTETMLICDGCKETLQKELSKFAYEP